MMYELSDDDKKRIADVTAKLLPLDGLHIELCGCWLWISGETKKHKEAIKATGCQWAPKKAQWYWRPEGMRPYYRKNKRPKSMQDIRYSYGSKEFKREED